MTNNLLMNKSSGAISEIDDTTNHSIKYVGSQDNSSLAQYYPLSFGAIGNDGKQMMFYYDIYGDVTDGGDEGIVYVIYNYPHVLSSTTTNIVTLDTSPTVTGSVTADDSVTDISGVQYLVDDNDPQGNWSECSASDGSFNSTSEEYKCEVAELAEGEYTVYIRSYDENTTYTAQANYGTSQITVDTTAPTGIVVINGNKKTTRNIRSDTDTKCQ